MSCCALTPHCSDRLTLLAKHAAGATLGPLRQAPHAETPTIHPKSFILPDQASWHAEDRKISEAGYQFLLLDTYSQLWRLLREYIASGEEVSGVMRGFTCHSQSRAL